jgi:hypothetical protein
MLNIINYNIYPYNEEDFNKCTWFQESLTETYVKTSNQLKEIGYNLKINFDDLKRDRYPFNLVYFNPQIPFKSKHIDFDQNGILLVRYFKIHQNKIIFNTIYNDTFIVVTVKDDVGKEILKSYKDNIKYIILNKINNYLVVDDLEQNVIVYNLSLNRDGFTKKNIRDSKFFVTNVPENTFDLREREYIISLYYNNSCLFDITN